MTGDVTFTPEEVKTMFAKHAGKLVLWTAAKTFLSTFYRRLYYANCTANPWKNPLSPVSGRWKRSFEAPSTKEAVSLLYPPFKLPRMERKQKRYPMLFKMWKSGFLFWINRSFKENGRRRQNLKNIFSLFYSHFRKSLYLLILPRYHAMPDSSTPYILTQKG